MTWPAWTPDKSQWRVIWIVYAIAFIFSLNYGPYDTTLMDGGWFIFYVVVAGALVLWKMEIKKRHPTSKPKPPQ